MSKDDVKLGAVMAYKKGSPNEKEDDVMVKLVMRHVWRDYILRESLCRCEMIDTLV